MQKMSGWELTGRSVVAFALVYAFAGAVSQAGDAFKNKPYVTSGSVALAGIKGAESGSVAGLLFSGIMVPIVRRRQKKGAEPAL